MQVYFRDIIFVLAITMFMIFGCSKKDDTTSENKIMKLSQKKIIILGMDAAEWRLINRFIERGGLPNFKRLKQIGTCGNLKTIEPTLSPIIWTSILTGQTPDKHGIQHMYLDYGKGGLAPVSNSLRKVAALWDIFSGSGMSVGAINWWATWPVQQINGYMISNQMIVAHRRFWTDIGYGEKLEIEKNNIVHPSELITELEPLMGIPGTSSFEEISRFVTMPASLEKNFKAPDKFSWNDLISKLEVPRMVDLTVENFYQYLKKRIPVDVTMLYLMGLDGIQHWFWEFMEPEKFKHRITVPEGFDFSKTIENYYAFTDKMLGRIMEDIKDGGGLFLMSDHGFEAIPSYVPGPGQISAGHENAPDGIFCAVGEGIKKGSRISLSIYDIAPTILAYMGLPVADDMVGQVKQEIFEKARAIEHIPTYSIPSYFVPVEKKKASKGTEKAILNRLKALGYIN